MFLKGTHGQEQVQRKKTKKTVQVVNRAVAGLSLEALLAKRNQTEDFRRQQREQAAKVAKDANKAARAAKQAANKVIRFIQIKLSLHQNRTKILIARY